MLRTIAIAVNNNDIPLKLFLLDTVYRCFSCSTLPTK